jgi:hypothetical protein
MVAWGGESALQDRTIQSVGLNAKEMALYKRMQKIPGLRAIKIVEVDERAFSHGKSEMAFFNGAKADFSVEKTKESDYWTGQGKWHLDRFSMRKSSDGYSGHILSNGIEYVIVPINKKMSVMYALGGGIQCGISDSGEVSNDRK